MTFAQGQWDQVDLFGRVTVPVFWWEPRDGAFAGRDLGDAQAHVHLEARRQHERLFPHQRNISKVLDQH